MNSLSIIKSCLIDPEGGGIDTRGLLRYDADKCILHIEYETNLNTADITVSASLQRNTIVWRDQVIAEASELTHSKGKITWIIDDLSSLPSTNDLNSLKNSYSRVLVTLQYSGTKKSIILPIAFERLPLEFESMHVFDPDSLTSPGNNVWIESHTKRIHAILKVNSKILSREIDVKIVYANRLAPPLAEKKITVLYGKTEFLIEFDPIPSGIIPTNPTDPKLEYNVIASTKDRGFSWRRVKKQMGMKWPVRNGSLRFDFIEICDEPFFEPPSSPKRTVSDSWDIITLSLQIKAQGYDPSSISRPCEVLLWITNLDGSEWLHKTGELEFDEDRIGLGFIDIVDAPSTLIEASKHVRVLVNHDGILLEDNFKVAFKGMFRPDRAFLSGIALPLSNSGQLENSFSPNTNAVRATFEKLENAKHIKAAFSLVLSGRVQAGHRVYYSTVRNVIAYRYIDLSRLFNRSDNFDFHFGKLPNDVFDGWFTSLRIHLIWAYFYNDIKYFGETVIGEYGLDSMNSSSEAKITKSNFLNSIIKRALQVVSVSPLNGTESDYSYDKEELTRQSLDYNSPLPGVDKSKYSGKHWVKKFPTSKRLKDLSSPFKENVSSFIKMLKANGASVKINATKRPRQRAYLMHYAFKIANKKIKASDVPVMKGVDIIWNHPRAVDAAKEMVSAYGIVYAPALYSKHILGIAIDMWIRNLNETLKFKANGKEITVKIGGKAAEKNKKLWAVAKKYYSVKKLPSDAPHWNG